MAELIARKIGEGFGRPNAEKELPIDIKYSDLVDWLVSRKKLASDWKRKVDALRARVAQAKLHDMPSTQQLQHAQHADDDGYLLATATLTELAKTADKSVFGALRGHAAVWQKIVKDYEQGYVWLGEVSQTLARNIDYEIPYRHKAIAKLQQQIEDFEGRRDDAERSASAAAAAFKQECEKLGINGTNLKVELLALTSSLPDKFTAVEATVHRDGVKDALKFYDSFTRFAHAAQQRDDRNGDSTQDDAEREADMLPTLRELLNGSTAPYSGATAAAITDTMAQELESIGHTAGEGNDAAASQGEPAISWDIADGVAANDSRNGGINWDIDMAMASEPAPADDDTPAPQAIDINWDIDISDVGADHAEPASSDAAASAQHDNVGTAIADEGWEEYVGSRCSVACARLLLDATYRTALIDDLCELKAFLQQRTAELGADGPATLSNDAFAHVDAFSVSAQSMRNMVAAVQSCIDAFNQEDMKKLLMIRTSKRHLDRMCKQLASKQQQESRLLQSRNEAVARMHAATKTLVQERPQLQQLIARTHELRKLTAAGMSDLLNGRIVNIQMPNL